MAEELFIPKLGQTVDEVTLINWLVEEGDKVEFGDPVLEVETDKAVFNVEANAKGFIHLGPYSVGETLPVLTVVATIGAEDDTFSPGTAESQPDSKDTQGAPQQPVKSSTPDQESSKKPSFKTGKVFASPRARKLAGEKKVDLALVPSTGGGGVRVIEDDVIAFLRQAPKATPIAQALAEEVGLELAGLVGTGPKGIIIRDDVITAIREKLSAAPTTLTNKIQQPQDDGVGVREHIPLRSVRKLIFDRMAASVHSTARVTLVTEVDVTDLAAYREQLNKDASQSSSFKVSYNDLIGLITARTLAAFPYMNARLSSDGNAIEILDAINLGVAVDTQRGLVVPVLKNANLLSIHDFGIRLRELVERARSGKSTTEDLTGGTFTITNLGNFGVDAFTPVINLPEVAILGIGRIQDQVVPYQGEVAIRKRVTLSLVFDHRVVDGAPASRFLQAVSDHIEHASAFTQNM